MEGSPRRTLCRAQEDRPADAGHERKSGHHGSDHQFVHAFAAHPQCAADHLPGLRPCIALSIPGPLSGACQTVSRSLRVYDDSYPSDRTHAVRRDQGHPVRLSPFRQGLWRAARLQHAFHRHHGPLGPTGDRRPRQGPRSHPVRQCRRLQQLRRGADLGRTDGHQRARLRQSAGSQLVDVLGFSLGGLVAQELTLVAPELVRRLVLVGTGPRSGESMASLTPEAQRIFGATYDPPDHLWLRVFFTPSEASQAAGRAYLKRFRRRTEDRDPEVNESVAPAQLEALAKWGAPRANPFDYLKAIHQPTLVINGHHDVIVYTINSYILQQNIPNAQLILYPDANHGSQYQYPERFVRHVSMFLSEEGT